MLCTSYISLLLSVQGCISSVLLYCSGLASCLKEPCTAYRFHFYLINNWFLKVIIDRLIENICCDVIPTHTVHYSPCRTTILFSRIAVFQLQATSGSIEHTAAEQLSCWWANNKSLSVNMVYVDCNMTLTEETFLGQGKSCIFVTCMTLFHILEVAESIF